MTEVPDYYVVSHIGLRKAKPVDTGLDAVMYKQAGWPEHRRVALAERIPGAPLIMMATMSESEISRACEALKDRECDGVEKRDVVYPRKLEGE